MSNKIPPLDISHPEAVPWGHQPKEDHMSLYHYTSTTHWPYIEASGVLKTVESNISPLKQFVGPNVVWLTDTPTADLGHGLTHSDVDKTAVRIEVDVPGVRWLDWEWIAHMPTWWMEAFIRAGGGPEAVEHWYVWPYNIKRKRWVSVEGAP